MPPSPRRISASTKRACRRCRASSSCCDGCAGSTEPKRGHGHGGCRLGRSTTLKETAMASRFLTPYSSARTWMQDPLFQLQREIDRVFEDVFRGGGSSNAGGRSGSTMMSAPRIDLQDSEGELRLHADLPGVQPSDLDIRIEGDVLTIRGERKSESERNEQNFHVMERSHGRFQRSIQLPFAPNPDEVQATVREGVLELRIPKRAPEERSRRIEIRGGQSTGGQSMTGAISGGSGPGP